MRVLLILAIAAAIDATEDGVDRPKDSCLLQLSTTNTKKSAAAIEEEDGAPEAFRSNEHNDDSVEPVVPKPLVLASTEASTEGSENTAKAWYAQALDTLRSKTTHAPVGSVTLSEYPGYRGGLKVSGNVTIRLPEGYKHLLLQWNMEGVDNNCAKGHSNPAANACGIHIHEGMVCTDAGGHYFKSKLPKTALPGPAPGEEMSIKATGTNEYWTKPGGYTSDPWPLFKYHSTESGKADGGGDIDIGLSVPEVLTHSVVVHDSAGARIACGVIVDLDAHSGTTALRTPFALLLMLVTTVFGIHA